MSWSLSLALSLSLCGSWLWVLQTFGVSPKLTVSWSSQNCFLGRLRCPQQFMFDEALWLKESYRDWFLIDFWFGLVLTGWSSSGNVALEFCFVKSPGTARHIQRSKPQARDCHCFKRWLPGSLFLGSQRSQNLCTVMLAQQISPFY